MSFATGIMLYFIIWWTFLFCTLPLWVRQDTPKAGQMPGAPENPYIKRKIIVTTIGAALIWGIVYICVDIKLFDFRQQAEVMIERDYGPSE